MHDGQIDDSIKAIFCWQHLYSCVLLGMNKPDHEALFMEKPHAKS